MSQVADRTCQNRVCKVSHTAGPRITTPAGAQCAGKGNCQLQELPTSEFPFPFNCKVGRNTLTMETLSEFEEIMYQKLRVSVQPICHPPQMLAGTMGGRSESNFILFPGHFLCSCHTDLFGSHTGPLHMLFLFHGMLFLPSFAMLLPPYLCLQLLAYVVLPHRSPL